MPASSGVEGLVGEVDVEGGRRPGSWPWLPVGAAGGVSRGMPVVVATWSNRSRVACGLANQPSAAARRWSLLRGSPRMPRLSATRSTVPSNRITSGASARTNTVLVPCSVDPDTQAPKDSRAAWSACSAASGSVRIQVAWMMRSSRVQEIRSAYGAISMSTCPQTGTVRGRVASATLRPIHALTSPAWTRAHRPGSRCRRSSAAATSRSAAWVEMPSTAPSSAVANSATSGVPAPPSRSSRSQPGSARLPGSVGETTTACRSAQCAAACSLATSAAFRAASAAAAYARVASASIPSRSCLISNMCSIICLTADTLKSRNPLWTTDSGVGHLWINGSRQARPPMARPPGLDKPATTDRPDIRASPTKGRFVSGVSPTRGCW